MPFFEGENSDTVSRDVKSKTKLPITSTCQLPVLSLIFMLLSWRRVYSLQTTTSYKRDMSFTNALVTVSGRNHKLHLRSLFNDSTLADPEAQAWNAVIQHFLSWWILFPTLGQITVV